MAIGNVSRRPISCSPAIVSLMLIAIGGILLVYLAWKIDQPMLLLAAGGLPLAAVVVWHNAFFVCALFICFAYFRLPEAYPFLMSLKPQLILGTTAVALFVLRALLSSNSVSSDKRGLHIVCLWALLAIVGLGFPYSLYRESSSTALDALMIPVIMLLAICNLVAWSSLLSLNRGTRLPNNLKLLVGFFCCAFVTSIFAIDRTVSFDFWTASLWKISAMSLAICWLARSERDFTLTAALFIICGVLVAAVTIFNKHYGIDLVEGSRAAIGVVIEDPDLGRRFGSDYRPVLKGILSDPNDLALVLLFPLSFALSKVLYGRSPVGRTCAVVGSGVILYGIVATQSRGALIGVLAAAVTLFFLRSRSRSVSLVVVALVTPILFGAMEISKRRSGGGTDLAASLDDSASHRIEAWETAWNMATSRPIVGVGIGNFPEQYRRYTEYWRGRQMAAHSMWFQVLAETGFVGLGLFIGMIVASFRLNAATLAEASDVTSLVHTRELGSGMQAALASTCASGTFLSQGWTWPIYMTVALMAGLAILTDSERAARRPLIRE